MSRIGKNPLEIPSGVEIKIEDNVVNVKGPKGQLSFEHSRHSKVVLEDGQIRVEKVGRSKTAPALWGTTRAIIGNMVKGVTEGFKKQLELHGVGYKMTIQGRKIVFNLGFSHPIEKEIPKGLTAEIEKNVLTISGIDKQEAGEFTAVIRSLKKVEPYKGKGFRYVGEKFIKKEGKRAAGTEK